MGVLQSEVFEAFRAIDIPEDKALRAAKAFGKRDVDVTSIRSELLLLEWMKGFVLTFQFVISSRGCVCANYFKIASADFAINAANDRKAAPVLQNRTQIFSIGKR